MTTATKCECTPCDNEAVAHVTYAHPSPERRWSANLCREHMRIKDGYQGTGEATYSAVKVKAP